MSPVPDERMGIIFRKNLVQRKISMKILAQKRCKCTLMYKLKRIVGRNDFSDQFRKNIIRYKRIGYNMNVMRQTACLVVNPITVNNLQTS